MKIRRVRTRLGLEVGSYLFVKGQGRKRWHAMNRHTGVDEGGVFPSQRAAVRFAEKVHKLEQRLARLRSTGK